MAGVVNLPALADEVAHPVRSLSDRDDVMSRGLLGIMTILSSCQKACVRVSGRSANAHSLSRNIDHLAGKPVRQDYRINRMMEAGSRPGCLLR